MDKIYYEVWVRSKNKNGRKQPWEIKNVFTELKCQFAMKPVAWYKSQNLDVLLRKMQATEEKFIKATPKEKHTKARKK